jgi:hypothetical protein
VSIYGSMKLVFEVYFMGLFAGFPTTPPFVLNPGAGQDPYLLNLAASKAFLFITQCSDYIYFSVQNFIAHEIILTRLLNRCGGASSLVEP